MEPGRGIGHDIGRGEAVEAELDRLISRRASQYRRPDPDELEPTYAGSVRRYNASKCEEMRAAWCEHHEGQAARLRAVLESLIALHEEQAERYRDQLTKGSS